LPEESINAAMSRAFVKETANDAPPPERMIADGPVPVTPQGFAQIEAEVARLEAALKTESNVLLRETLERDLRYWAVKKARAEIVKPTADGTVAFGSRVTITRDGKRQSLRVVGEDEANPREGLISVRSPLAQALLGARAGDTVEMEKPRAEIEIIAVG
jgi:transcription elongation GreA/GreB family factor